MKLLSFTQRDTPDLLRVGVSADESVLDLSALVPPGGPNDLSPMRRLIGGCTLRELAYARDKAPAISTDQIRLQPPVPDPSKIMAAPVNYIDHQHEMNESVHVDGLGVFLKAPSSVLAHGAIVRLPYLDRRFDQEGELAVVIGTRASHVDPDNAMNCVFGYTPLLDMTMRGGEDRSTRKSFDTFTPMGPCLVTADEIEDPAQLTLTCSVNGTVRQNTGVKDLIWSVPRLVAYASSVMTLLPGDIITTGTPAGVGAVADGDQVEVVIDRLPKLNVSVSAAGATTCPTRGADRGPVPPPVVTTLQERS